MKKTKLIMLAAGMMTLASISLAQNNTHGSGNMYDGSGNMYGTAQDNVHVWNDPHAWWGNHFVYGPTEPDMYRANEISFDAFGTFTAAENNLSKIFKTNIRNGKWGGGVGLNYFLTRAIGIGGDLNAPDNGGNFIDSMNLNLIVRLPLGKSGVAPYVFGGGGRQTQPVWTWTAAVGAGMEIRLNPITALFTDARYIWPDKSGVSDSVEIRSGLRLIF